jgi:hypothetical protein
VISAQADLSPCPEPGEAPRPDPTGNWDGKATKVMPCGPTLNRAHRVVEESFPELVAEMIEDILAQSS